MNRDVKTGQHSRQILYACYADRHIEGENFISDHVFSYIISGEQEMWIGNKTYHFKTGDIRFFAKNQLARYVKKSVNEEYRALSVYIDEFTLRELAVENSFEINAESLGKKLWLLKPNNYLKAYIKSLSPYIDGNLQNSENITRLKVKELVNLLVLFYPDIKATLFNFSDPGKLDLEGFMNEHYRYNVDIGRFAYLTGRSLSGFKRDFKKIFNQTPGRWLVEKRLKEARYLIQEKNKRPGEIYLGLGFENLSHFSTAYRKAYGGAPTKID
ncbi:AraC family transcriptional regulator [Prolixibacter sp. NT017]|uniref:AraC family transcriptional regulator n=1 Tax=Prolixibacter sp. NT017 TaxID=2652390 RepID=UPI001282AEB2|nr:AraC family transcriptional regulator [Prolixibacter sp. NT017]GET25523.1 AraC family transcriptional regulator [Prolixibacter sp. NT017]